MKSNVQTWCFLLISCISFFSCREKEQPILVKDGDLTIQARRLENKEQGSNTLSYAVRITPGKKFSKTNDPQMSTEFWYKMDSCFYMQTGAKKIYASLVQPIANGVSGTFEYMLEFETVPRNTEPEFVYQDKYLNHKKYNLKFY